MGKFWEAELTMTPCSPCVDSKRPRVNIQYVPVCTGTTRMVGEQHPQHACLQRGSLLTLSEDVAALQLSFKRLAAAVMWCTGTPVREEGAGRRDQVSQTPTTGPWDADGVEDRGSPAFAVHRQSCAVACGLADLAGDQACRDSADSVHQQSGRSACGVAATGFSDGVEDRGSPSVAVHRQSCDAGDHSDQPGDQACRIPADSALRARVDAATGSSYGVEDRGRPTVAVLRQICAAGDHPDQPGDQACRDSADSALRKSGPVTIRINQVTKHVEIHPIQYINKLVAVPIVIQRQVPQVQTVPETAAVPTAQSVGRVVNVPVICRSCSCRR